MLVVEPRSLRGFELLTCASLEEMFAAEPEAKSRIVTYGQRERAERTPMLVTIAAQSLQQLGVVSETVGWGECSCAHLGFSGACHM